MKNDKVILDTEPQVEDMNDRNGLKIAVGVGIAAVAAVAAGILLTKDKEESEERSNKMVRTPGEVIEEVFEQKKNELKDAAEQINADVRQETDRFNGKMDDVKKHVHSGYKKIKKTLHKTASAISRDMK